VKCLRDSDCMDGSAKSCVEGKCTACDPNGQNTCPLCKKCSDQGSCVNQTKGEDLNSECPRSNQSSSCATGSCNGSGACGVLAINTSCGTCMACDSSGVCVYVASGKDPNSDCDPASSGESTSSSCKDGYCDGSGGCHTTTANKCYRDGDNDGYGTPTMYTYYCGGSCPSTGWVSNSKDCYDTNAKANPDQTEYFETSRGDGSFDYDCKNGQEKKNPDWTNQTCASTCSSGQCVVKSGAATACGERPSTCLGGPCPENGASQCPMTPGYVLQSCR
jgi:hypothetical protein